MVRGRKPLPLELKLVKGKKGIAQKVEDNPFVSLDELIDPPEFLTEAQAAEWRYVIEHAAPGQLRTVDRAVLATYVVALDKWREALMRVNAAGLVVKSPVKGEPMQNPYLAILNKQALIVMRAAAEMGLTPSSRSRVSLLQDGGKAKDDFDF